MKACLGRGGIPRRGNHEGTVKSRSRALLAYQIDKVCLYDIWDGLPPRQQDEDHGYIRHFLEPTSRASQPAFLSSADAVCATLRNGQWSHSQPIFPVSPV